MIILKKLTYKNFKSSGNSPITIQLDKHSTTLICGKNGSGKSAVTSALAFALFGQDFVLNKPGLINSINQKNLEVSIEFSIGPKNYKVIRGIKPNIFKIFENDVLLNEDSSSRDYQKVLETQILKMDIRAFMQVVVVGGRNYVPFMRLKSNDRREFIEDLLDIRVFSTMGIILKEKIKLLKEEMRTTDEELKTIKEKVSLQEAFVKKLTIEKSISISKIESGIGDFELKLAAYDKDVQILLIREKELTNSQLELCDVQDEILNHRMQISGVKEKIRDVESSINFFNTVETCPTCTQEIKHEHKDLILLDHVKTLAMHNVALVGLETLFETIKRRQDESLDIQKKIVSIQNEISDLQNKIHFETQLIIRARQQISELNSDTTSIDVEKTKLKDFAKQYVDVSNHKKKILEQQQYNELYQQILSDGGIKSKIVKQYIPTINKFINQYLAKMDFFVSFYLDENFDEVIKSRHRDTFKYDNFSDGQKARIDLSLMFAWRDVARLRNAVNVNTLFLDESDAAIDAEGASLLSDLLKTIKDSNIFLISHKGDLIRDKVDDSLEFALVNNFTQIVSNQ